MRIISGTLKGRKINPPSKMSNTRPTTDLAREGLFNVLSNHFDVSSLETLDLFGGTGAISFEFASRGSASQTIVEKDGFMADFIKHTNELLNIQSMTVVRMDVFNFLRNCTNSFDLVFADPPYGLPASEQLPELIFNGHIIKEGGWFILEHTTDQDFTKHVKFKSERKYGSTIFSIFSDY